MVNMDKVVERVKRGAYTGLGAFAAGFISDEIESRTGFSELAVDGSLVLIGAGVSVGADRIAQDTDSTLNDVVEFAGYGIQANGFAEAGQNIAADIGDQSSSQTSRRVSVSANASRQTGQSTSEETGAHTRREEFLADVG